MKNFFLIFVTVLLSISSSKIFSQDYWKSISSPTDKLMRNLFFVDSLTGWCAGQEGTIIRTTDGGLTWKLQNSTVETFIVSIFFLDENRGWALTIKDTPPFSTIILSTSNGGEEWYSTLYPAENIFMNTVFFFDSLNGFLGGTNIARTTNGGLSWQDANVDSNMISGLPVHKFNFYNRQFGYACGGFIDLAGVIWKTTDYGLNWSAKGVSPDQVFDLAIMDSLNAISLSGDPEGFFGIGNIKTTDAGESWSFDEMTFFSLSFAIDFRTGAEAWSASGLKFLYSSNRGEEWMEMSTPDSSVIYDLQFTDSTTGYACGENGVILKYLNKPVPPNDSIPTFFSLSQNYPNPFNRSTIIKFIIPNNVIPGGVKDLVTLKIYDVLGNEIYTLVNEDLGPGEYEVEFKPESGTRHPVSGTYFYQLRAANLVQTKKMLLLK